MWIEPTTFFRTPARSSACGCRVGQDFLGDPLPSRCSAHRPVRREDAAGRKPLVGRDGADPAGLLRVAEPGLLVIGYRSNPSPVELTADKFNQYLKEEGLDAIAALRARRRSDRRGPASCFRAAPRASCSRDPAQAAKGDRALGFTLELVAEKNPYTLRRAGRSGSPDLRKPAAGGRPRRRDQPSEPNGEALGAQRQERPRALPPAARWHVADQGRAHDSRDSGCAGRLGKLLGDSHLRDSVTANG